MALTLIMKGGLPLSNGPNINNERGLPLSNGPNINNERGGYLYQMALTLIMKGGATFIKWP